MSKTTEGLRKTCAKCLKDKSIDVFCLDAGYKDGRRSDCNLCRSAARRKQDVGYTPRDVLGLLPSATKITPTFVPYFTTIPEQDLPTPERLPAAYLKRCSDYWTDLVGGNNPTQRIA